MAGTSVIASTPRRIFDQNSSTLLALGKSASAKGERNNADFQFPLFETLVRTLDRNPAKLDQISRLVNDLKKTESGCERLPEGFDEIWQPIWTAREALKKQK